MPRGRLRHRVILATIEVEGRLVKDAPKAAGELGTVAGEVVGAHLVDYDQDGKGGALPWWGQNGTRGSGLEEQEEGGEHP